MQLRISQLANTGTFRECWLMSDVYINKLNEIPPISNIKISLLARARSTEAAMTSSAALEDLQHLREKNNKENSAGVWNLSFLTGSLCYKPEMWPLPRYSLKKKKKVSTVGSLITAGSSVSGISPIARNKSLGLCYLDFDYLFYVWLTNPPP